MEWAEAYAAIFRTHNKQLHPVHEIDSIRLQSLVCIDRQKADLVANTERFVSDLPANNALLWGARGTGKSSLIKAVLNEYAPRGLRLIEIYKTDLISLPEITDEVRGAPYKFLIYCDDFSFEENDGSYVALKTVLEGSIEMPPKNVLLYVTSNRRHLMPEYMSDNLDTRVEDRELHYSDAVEERISLSDRFGLWIPFYPPSTAEYLSMVDSYFPEYSDDRGRLHIEAKKFAQLRASKSGRTAKQFFNFFSKQSVGNKGR
jgi:predicted AAA+ superfamily ATPase